MTYSDWHDLCPLWSQVYWWSNQLLYRKGARPLVNRSGVALFKSPSYKYSEVAKWTKRIRRPGRRWLLDIPEICILINRICEHLHWLLLWICTTTQTITITIWNSFGPKSYHYHQEYLGDVYAEQDEREEPIETWKSRWTFQDLSDSSPAQTNSSDCGLFAPHLSPNAFLWHEIHTQYFTFSSRNP